MKKLLLLLPLCIFGLGASCGPPPPPPPPQPETCTCRPPGSEAAGWVAVPGIPPAQQQWAADVFAKGRDALGDVCGKDPGESIDKMVTFFQQNQTCAGRWPEAVIAARPDGRWEEWHVVTTGAGVEGCWATVPGAYKGVWENNAVAKSCPRGFCEHGCDYLPVGGK